MLWRERRPQEATETLEKFLHALSQDPWSARELIKTITRARRKPSQSRTDQRSRPACFTTALRAPFCVYINESDRLDTWLALGIYLDGDHPSDLHGTRA